MRDDLIEEIDVGTRRVTGTTCPVRDQLRRTGEREWTIVRELCNGVPRTSETYRSESTAREAFGTRLEGRKPRSGSAASPVTIRATDEERAAWERAANNESLGAWIRDLCNQAAKR